MILAVIFAARWVAQATGGGSGGDTTSIVTLVTQIGLSAVFLWQWRDERRERREGQKTLLDLIERFFPALEASTATLERVQQALHGQVDRVNEHAEAVGSEAAKQIRDAAAALAEAIEKVQRGDGR